MIKLIVKSMNICLKMRKSVSIWELQKCETS